MISFAKLLIPAGPKKFSRLGCIAAIISDKESHKLESRDMRPKIRLKPFNLCAWPEEVMRLGFQDKAVIPSQISH